MKDNLAVYLLRMNWYERAVLEKALKYYADKYLALDPKFLPLVKRADAVAAIKRAVFNLLAYNRYTWSYRHGNYYWVAGPGIRTMCAENLLCKLNARPLKRNIRRRDRTLPKYRYLAFYIIAVLEACDMEW